jgi:hypothetical protein
MITIRAIGGGTNFESRKRAEGAYAVVARGVPGIDGASWDCDSGYCVLARGVEGTIALGEGEENTIVVVGFSDNDDEGGGDAGGVLSSGVDTGVDIVGGNDEECGGRDRSDIDRGGGDQAVGSGEGGGKDEGDGDIVGGASNIFTEGCWDRGIGLVFWVEGAGGSGDAVDTEGVGECSGGNGVSGGGDAGEAFSRVNTAGFGGSPPTGAGTKCLVDSIQTCDITWCSNVSLSWRFSNGTTRF